jgi:hypothetical protein
VHGSHHQAACGDGHCLITGQSAPSKLQGRIFGLLDYVVGPGRANYERSMWSGQPLRIDMLFESDSLGHRLAVEYDGAYFHRDRYLADHRKNERIHTVLSPVMIVRIREDPLEPVSELDVLVPPRSAPELCARATLLHLLHSTGLKPELSERIQAFIRIGRPSGRMLCRGCNRAEERIGSHVITIL